MKRTPLLVCARSLRPLCSLVLLFASAGSGLAGVIASSNFTSGGSGDSLPAVTWTPTFSLGAGVPANDSYAAISASGTVDTTTNTGGPGPFAAGTRGNALRMNLNFTGVTGSTWTGSLQTPILTITNAEAALDRLNISFDMNSNRTLPVRVRVESFTATSTTPTGASDGIVIPPLYNSFYRYSVDLNTLTKPAGYASAFIPTGASGARFRISFALDGATGLASGWPATTNNIITVDNICYTSPARWVGTGGVDTSPGTSPSAPTTVQHAFDLVQPGDVICFLGNTFNNIPSFQNVGTPSRWVTLRAAPGATPIITSSGGSAITIAGSSAYVDVRGFTIQGMYDPANAVSQVTAAQLDGTYLNTYSGQQTNPAYTIYSGDPFGRTSNISYGNIIYNTDGINLNGRQKRVGGSIVNTADTEGVHHVRIADNIIMDMPGAGIGANKSDYVFVENNTVTECAHLSRSAVSGFTVISNINFDGDTDTKIFVVGNEFAHNREDVRWTKMSGSGNAHVVNIFYSDGNGIIIDVNRNHDFDSNITLPPYAGRTLVQNNVSYESGGSGIHTIGSAHVDIVNNTVFNNNQPNQGVGTEPSVTYTQTSATANTYPVSTYSTTYDTQTGPYNRAGTSEGYGELFAGSQSQDIHLFNNIAWAPAGSDINAKFPYLGSAISYNNNVFGRYGADGGLYTTGFTNYTNNAVVSSDPLKIFTSVTEGVSTFLRLETGNANYAHTIAIDFGVNTLGAPIVDFDGDLRPVGTGFDAGAFEADY